MSEPFLKWAGGKRWLASSGLLEATGEYSRLIEPFLGSAAVFFHLKPNSAILSDLNSDLIELYVCMKDFPSELYAEMEVHRSRHSNEYYYEIRASTPSTTVSRASRFLYLNRTCWNGLFRVNLRGEFNVPRGTKDTVLFEGEDFSAFSSALRNAEILSSDFELVIDRAGLGDLLFVDPPYTVQHNLNGFIKYNERLFRWEDQVRLRDAIQRAIGRGARVMMTNADHASVRELYEGMLEYRSVARASVLAAQSVHRGRTTEALFTKGI